jgi:hypothetical protein
MTRIHTFFFLLLFTLVATESWSSKPATPPFLPGSIIPEGYIRNHNSEQFFRIMDIPDSIFRCMQGASYPINCPIKRSQLKYILCLHRDIKGRSIVGEMIVNKSIAHTMLNIFHQLYKAKYPIEKMRLPENWKAMDEPMMRDNNTSAFNFRYISGTKRISKHGMGLAIDINPLYNPYYSPRRNGKIIIEPTTGRRYLNRSATFPYKIVRGDLLYRLMTENGFRWGGDWKNSKDYQHFEKM